VVALQNSPTCSASGGTASTPYCTITSAAKVAHPSHDLVQLVGCRPGWEDAQVGISLQEARQCIGEDALLVRHHDCDHLANPVAGYN
jgi:hypothetical protein